MHGGASTAWSHISKNPESVYTLVALVVPCKTPEYPGRRSGCHARYPGVSYKVPGPIQGTPWYAQGPPKVGGCIWKAIGSHTVEGGSWKAIEGRDVQHDM